MKDFHHISKTNIDEDKDNYVHVFKDYSLRVRSTYICDSSVSSGRNVQI